MGDRALSDAMHEIDMYQLFQSQYIIRVLVRWSVVFYRVKGDTDVYLYTRIQAY